MNEKQKYQQFCCDLQKEYINALNGEGERNNIVYDTLPSEKFVIGVLDSGVDINDDRTFARTMPIAKVQAYSDLRPEGKLRFAISGSLFYNTIPSYEEEMEYINNKKNEERGLIEDLENGERIFDKPRFRRKFQRVSLLDLLPAIEIEKKELLKKGVIDLSDSINAVLQNEENFPNAIFYGTDRSITLESIESKEQYDKYIERNSFKDNSQIIKAQLRWKFKVIVSCDIVHNNKCLISFSVENVTEVPYDDYKIKSKKRELMDLKYHIPVYNIGLKIAGDNDFKFEQIFLNSFEKTYKVDSAITAKGEWLTAKFNKKRNEIYTENSPVFKEYRILTRDEYNKATSFKNLQNNPIENLNIVLKGMKDYYGSISFRKELEGNEEYQNDLKKFRQEIKRFEDGIKILSSDDFKESLEAFILMNKSFERNGYNEWRLFQLVFIVSIIPDIVYQNNSDYLKTMYGYKDDDAANILFFPTGGGKTEAFLGTVALSMFYDRLIGKQHGVNSIIKYPLRLLSVQQLERTLGMILKANEVLEKEYPGMQPFSLGYFVGGANTPNSIDTSKLDEYEHNSKFILIKKCPFDTCDGDIDVIFNSERHVLEHKCLSCGKILPLYEVDTDIYRFTPTIVISTVDKFATIANRDGFRNLLGGANRYCKKHGFCSGKKCSIDGNDEVIDVDSIQNQSMVPSFLIQDEVHLLKESLGVFSAHYDSLVDEYTAKLLPEGKRKQIKHIGATATISGADSLIAELYNKECVIFPSPSTNSNGDNFYSYRSADDLGRIIIGFAPYGDSIMSRMEYSVSTFRIILDEYYKNAKDYCAQYDMDEEQFRQMVFYYWTTIIYFQSKRDTNDLRDNFEQQANYKSLIDHPDARFNMVKMTGDEFFSDIKSSLQNIEAEKDKRKAYNLVLATSTISHGVDSKEFNDMFFYGIPSNTAEYIQSYSRVGRFYTGIVIDVIRLKRNRDISFLKYFDLYHKYKEYLIDETDMNVKSVVAIERTFPGVFLALLRHYFAVKNNHSYDTLKSVSEFMKNKGDIMELFEVLCSIYRCQNYKNDSYDNMIAKILVERINKIKDNVYRIISSSAINDTKITARMGELTEDEFEVMSSLRNVDETYEIGLAKGGKNETK